MNPVEHGLSIFTIDEVYVWNCTKYNEWRYSQISICEEKRLKAITVRAVNSFIYQVLVIDTGMHLLALA